jgi:sodium-dependent dicarboxylate transporter 2/3/5
MNVFLTNLDKVQLVCIFISSFLISRVLIVAKIPERLVLYLIGKKHLPISTIIFYVIFASALLSFFIPNVITVLTLLPMIKILRRTFEESLPHRYKALETIFPLSIIYGANIGGMGSITGTPANGIMVLYATFHNLPGLEYLNFQYWLVWGVPLVLAFILTAWFVLNAAFRLWTYQNELVQVTFPENRAFHPLQRTATRLTVLSFLLFVLLSVLMKTSEAKLGILLISVFLTLLLIAVLFLVPLKGDHGESSGRLLSIRDCYSNLPWRGLAFVGIIIAILGLGALLNLEEIITRFLSEWYA